MKTNGNLLLIKIQEYVDRVPFAKDMRITVLQASRGFVSLAISPQDRLFNHFNTYQAGVLFTLAEVTGGALCGTFLDLSQTLVLTRKGEITFRRGSSLTILSEASLENKTIEDLLLDLVRLRKIELQLEVQLKDDAGHILASCHFFYYLRSEIPRSFLPRNTVRGNKAFI